MQWARTALSLALPLALLSLNACNTGGLPPRVRRRPAPMNGPRSEPAAPVRRLAL